MALFKRSTPLGERLTALEDAAEIGAPYLSPAQKERLEKVARAGAERRALSAEHTVVGFFGATGSGKTSLFNAVVGEDLGKAAARRPTTSSPLAAVWEPAGSEELLDWLEVEDRRTRPGEFAPGAGPLILLDLPDFDSVELSNREIATRLAGQVDVLVWVSDPEKYADSVIHEQFIQPHANHSAVTLAVLNKSDLLGSGDVSTVAQSYAQLLRSDGLTHVSVLPTSTLTGAGIGDVRAAIARVARAHSAQSARIEADIVSVTDEFVDGTKTNTPDKRAKRELDKALNHAVGADRLANTTAAAYRKRLFQRTGWPVVSWMARFRPDPLKRLGLREDPDSVGVHRSSLPELDAASKAVANKGVREYAAAVAEGLPHQWAGAVFDRADDVAVSVPAELDVAVTRTKLPAEPSKAWGVLTFIQWLAFVAALVGALWYLIVALVPGILTPLLGDDLVPDVEGWPIPTLLIMVGILVGVVIGLMSAGVGGIVGSNIKRRTRTALRKEISAMSEATVVAPLEEIRDDYVRFTERIAVAAGA